MRILLFNPRSANAKYRLPNSLLALGSVLEGKHEYAIVDGNFLGDPLPALRATIEARGIQLLGVTVMPGPQLQQTVPLLRALRSSHPRLVIVLGGYFPSNHPRVVATSPTVDFVVIGQGERAFPALVDALDGSGNLKDVPNLAYRAGDRYTVTPSAPLIHPDALPGLPYHRVDVERYVGRTYLGSRTLSYHSSYGCPFECAFCAIVPIYHARWLGKNAALMANDVERLVREFGANAIEFHDNNFFTSEGRMVEFSEEVLRRNLRFSWWGEGRPDTLLRYESSTFALMKRAGLKMVFMGAESGDDATLEAMNKGGTQTGAGIADVVAKFGSHGIVPECSFVLGTPSKDVRGDINREIRFMRRLKRINPQTEIILYIYSPIPMEGAALYRDVTARGFNFPSTLDDWLKPEWASFDLRRNPLTPWLKPRHIRKVRSFERVLNARFPTVSDIRLTRFQRVVLKTAGFLRYAVRLYYAPVELHILQRLFHYRQPELQGF